MADESCKHPEGKPGKHCGDCGALVADPGETQLENIIERVLSKHGVIKKPDGAPPKKETLLESIIKPKGKTDGKK